MDMTPQTWPEWYDGRHINEVLFCQKFLEKHPMKCVRGRLFTVDGLIEDEGQIGNLILEEISGVLTANLSKTVANLLASIKLQAYSPPLPIETDRIHVANGTYFMDGRFSEEKSYCNNRLTVAYNPNASAPNRWLQFLSELLQEEDIPTLQEFLGYCLLPTTKGQKMLLMIGKGGEGKSRIGLVMRSLLGDSMNATSIQKVESNRFSRADLENKLLMVDDDMDMSALPKTNYIKSIVTSECKMDMERKGVQSYQSQLYVRFLCFGNGALTALHDKSDGFFRRQIVLTTKDRPAGRADDPFLVDKLLREKEGIFLWCLEGLHRLIGNNYQFSIYHLEAKVVSRSAGRSAVAASAYLSCSCLYNDYDGIQHDYTRKQGLVWQQIFLPEYAPQEWQDREKLWNAVEEVETAKDSRLAREFVVALPIELSQEQQIELLQAFIQEQFVSDGMCADAAIHDTDGHNPHAHILLTVRPLDEQGHWQYKTEKEYLCMRNGEECGFTAAEFRTAQNEGWEKQYPYKVDKKKVYMPPSVAEAQGLVRADKHPKSTRYGRQNPISARWNSEEQLAAWRAAWADITNRHLERCGHDEHIDHRSNAARGLDEWPTIHEGVTARALERKGVIADRCEINRQIKADNALLRELKATVKTLGQTVKNTIPAIAEAMEKLRANMIVFRYQLRHIGRGRQRMKDYIHAVQPKLVRYTELVQEIRGKSKERKSLLAEKKATPFYLIPKQHELSRRIAELTEELEELKSEKDLLLHSLECTDDAGIAAVKKDISTMEAALKKLSQQEEKYTAELNDALQQYADLREQAVEFDPDKLQGARLALRPAMERSALDRVQSAYGNKYDPLVMYDSKRDVAGLLHEEMEARSIRERLRQDQRSQQKPHGKKKQDRWER